MGFSLEDILATAKNGSTVTTTIASNEEDGIVSYAKVDLVYTARSWSKDIGGVRRPHLRTAPTPPMKIHFSDRLRVIDVPGSSAKGFGPTPRQPFDADRTEPLTVSVNQLDAPKPAVTLSFFGTTTTWEMERQGKLLVGLGPSLGPSEGGVYVISFIGINDHPG